MKSSRPSLDPAPEGKVLLPTQPPTFDKLSAAEQLAVYGEVNDFLQKHGRPIPKPRAFRNLRDAMKAIVVEEVLRDDPAPDDPVPRLEAPK
jgi:hypothetical protein